MNEPFIPAFGFEPFFGLETSSFDRIFRRRHIETAEKTDSGHSAQASLPSALSLDDKIIPSGIGFLEKSAFFGSAAPADSNYPYLFFYRAGQSLNAANPRYLVYKPLDIPSAPYAQGYFTRVFEDYSADGHAEYIDQQRSTPSMLEQQPISPTYLWSPSYGSAQSAQKSQYGALQANLSKYETKLEIKTLDWQIAGANEIYNHMQPAAKTAPAPEEKTIEIIVAKAEIRALQIPKAQVYVQTLPVQIQTTTPSFEPSTVRLDSRVHFFSVQRPRTESRQYHSENQALGDYTKNTTPYIFNPARNYDMDQRGINILSSGFWKGSLTPSNGNQDKLHNYKGRPAYKKAGAKSKEKTGPAYGNPARNKNLEDSESPAETHTEAKKYNYRKGKSSFANGQAPAEKYKDDKNDEPAKSDKSPIYKTKDDKKPKKNSALMKIGYIAAGIGLMGLVAVMQPAESKRHELNVASLAYQSAYEKEKPGQETINIASGSAKTEAGLSQQFKADLGSIVNDAIQLGYGSVSMSIRKNSTNEYFGIDDKTRRPGPSANKVAIAFAAAYLAQQGLLNLDDQVEIDKECTLERELERYSMFKERKLFGYEELRRLMLRESVNTAANLMLKFIGKGNVKEGERAVERVMEAIGLGDIKIAHYNVDEEYLKGVTTTENAERLQGYILKGKHLASQYLNPIKEDLENESHLDFGRNILGGKAGTKITMFKTGAGFAFHFGDYSGAVLFNDSNKPLWTDEVNDAVSVRKFEFPMFNGTRELFGRIFSTMKTYLAGPNYERKAA